MVRVAGLQDQVKVGFTKPENKAGMTPKQQLNEIAMKTHQLVDLQYETLQKTLLPKLQKEHVEFVKMTDLGADQLDIMERHFEAHIFPVLTPNAIDAHRPFPMFLDKGSNLAVVLEGVEDQAEEGQKIAMVQVPSVLDRFVRLESKKRSYKRILPE